MSNYTVQRRDKREPISASDWYGWGDWYSLKAFLWAKNALESALEDKAVTDKYKGMECEYRIVLKDGRIFNVTEDGPVLADIMSDGAEDIRYGDDGFGVKYRGRSKSRKGAPWSEWKHLLEYDAPVVDTMEKAKEIIAKEIEMDRKSLSNEYEYRITDSAGIVLVEYREGVPSGFADPVKKAESVDQLLVDRKRWDALTGIELRLETAVAAKEEEIEKWKNLIVGSGPQSAQRFRYGQMKNDAVRELAELKSFLGKEKG